MNGLSRNVLVLNKLWSPIEVTDALDAMTKVFQGKAVILDESYIQYGWQEWIQNWSDAAKLATVMYTNLITLPHRQIPIPEIIILKKYSGFRKRGSRPCRAAVHKRDRGICQYCGNKKPSSELNIDHVIPVGLGGKTTWTNVVLACIRCNHKKGMRTPEQAGMKLLRKPIEPHWALVSGKSKVAPPKSWADFLGKMYWNAELEE